MSTAILHCDLGPVMDISALGIRIGMSRKPPFNIGGEVVLGLQSPKDDLDVRAKVVRVHSVGGGRYEVALEFVSGKPDLGEQVLRLARSGSVRGPTASDPAKRDQIVAALKLPDYYACLKISPSSSSEQIHAAYRGLARQYHPDMNKDVSAQQRFVQINEAHDVLMDEQRRSEYDRLYVLRPVI